MFGSDKIVDELYSLRKEMKKRLDRGAIDWEELQRAIKDLWKNKDKTFSKDLTIRLTRNYNTRDEEMSIFIVEADNCYNEDKGWKWEIFLRKDGTWYID